MEVKYLQLLGVVYIIIGICAIVLKRYPGKNKSLKKLKHKYANVDESKLVLFEGITYLTSGLLWVIIFSFYKMKYNQVSSYIIIFLFLMFAIVYFPMRKKFVGLK